MKCFGIFVLFFFKKKVFLYSCSKEEDEVMLYSCVSVCPSVCLSLHLSLPQFHQFFFLYAFKEKYETCWIASNCQTTDQVDTFVACSLHIFQKIILYIPFFFVMSWFVIAFDVYEKKAGLFCITKVGFVIGFWLFNCLGWFWEQRMY